MDKDHGTHEVDAVAPSRPWWPTKEEKGCNEMFVPVRRQRKAEKDGLPVTSPHQAQYARSRFTSIIVLARDISAGKGCGAFAARALTGESRT